MEPSAEQYRLASMLDASTTADQEKETEQKIQKVVEFTGCNNDKVNFTYIMVENTAVLFWRYINF